MTSSKYELLHDCVYTNADIVQALKCQVADTRIIMGKHAPMFSLFGRSHTSICN